MLSEFETTVTQGLQRPRRPRRARLNMRIPVELLDWAKEYAVYKNKNVTQIFIDYLTQLKEKANGHNGKTS